MTASNTIGLTVRLPSEVKARLEKLAKATSTAQSTLASEAIVAFVEDQERQLARIHEGLADAKAGHVVEDEAVTRWLDELERAPEAPDDPFAHFDEWASEADTKGYDVL